MVESIKGNCKYCPYTATVGNLMEHQMTCEEMIVSCINSECNITVKRGGSLSHAATCLYTILSCKMCHEPFERRQMEFHEMHECPGRSIPCFNNCDAENVTRFAFKY